MFVYLSEEADRRIKERTPPGKLGPGRMRSLAVPLSTEILNDSRVLVV